jgi:chaperonin GroEL
MQAKELKFGVEAHQKIAKGVDLVADAVRTTIGPRGRYVIMGVGPEAPYVTKDGKRIASQMELTDRFENLGAQAMCQVVSQMADEVGDGTSTAALLAQAMVREGLKRVVTGIDPAGMRRGMEAAATLAARELARVSRPCLAAPELRQAAIVAANGDEEIGALLAEAVRLVGVNGTITIDDGYAVGNEMIVTEGMELDWPALTTRYGNGSDGLARLDNARIGVVDGAVSTPGALLPLLELVSEAKVPLVIFAHDVDDYVLALLAMNVSRGVLKVYAVKAAGMQEERRAALEDLALTTGATILSTEIGRPLKRATLEDLGRAQTVRITAKGVTITGGGGDKGVIAARARRLTAASKNASGLEQHALRHRIARLAGAVATITVGAATKVAAEEKRERFEAASLAVRAAAEEGVVPGGGVALLRAAPAVADLKQGHEAFDAGVDVVLRALQAPLCQIAANAGQEPAVVLSKVRRETGNYGFNAATCEYGDLFKLGVIDPAKVVRAALRNAVSVAGSLLTTECLVVAASTPRTIEMGALH